MQEVLAVANTRHGLDVVRPLAASESVRAPDGSDRLRSPRETVAFLSAMGVHTPPSLPTRDDLLRLRDAREAARALAEGDEHGYERRLARSLAAVTLRMDARGELHPLGHGWEAFIDRLFVGLVPLRGLADRMRICANPACGWFFVDGTRNGTQLWCTEQKCSSRVRARRYRRRRALR